jgi:predicted Zn finger-like uncharacterized protein
MIITCASCLTKFNLDDSRISPKGVKVRCSRCKHVFYVVPPPETKEEIIEGAESFAKYHEDLMGPVGKKAEVPPEVEVEKKEVAPEEEEGGVREEEEEEETFLFSEKAPVDKMEKLAPLEKLTPPEEEERVVPPEKVEKPFFEETVREESMEVKPPKPKRMVRAERRGLSRFFALFVVLVLLVFGILYVWTELSSGGKLSPYLESPVKKISELWNQIWGVEKEDLIVEDLNGYEEKMGEISLFIIEGKVKNQSQYTKKYIKIRVVIFGQDKLKVDQKEAICGRIISREELKKQPLEFLRGEMVIKPETNKEMVAPSGKATPFMVIFKDPPSQAKEFKVEIVEAPNL